MVCGRSRDVVTEIKAQKMLNTLPEKHRIVILLKFYEEMTYQEIADILCCPLGTVKSRIHEGIEKLRKVIKNEVL
jgi:RNA polymerase sigma-70 factor (ECF subfamily)